MHLRRVEAKERKTVVPTRKGLIHLVWLCFLLVGTASAADRSAVAEHSSRELMHRETISPDVTVDRREPLKLLVVGDSLTSGFILGKTLSFPSILEQLASKEDKALSVINGGVNGDTVEDGLRRLPTLLNSEFDVFMVALGTNDFFLRVPVDEVERDLIQILKLVRDRQPEAALIIAGFESAWSGEKEYRERFEAVYPRAARKFDAIYVPSLLKGISGKPEYHMYDMVHPNAAGQRRMAELLWPRISRLY